MTELRSLTPYRDERGNEIIYSGNSKRAVLVNFSGTNNRLIISAGANIAYLNVQFDRDNGTLEIGTHKGVGPLRLFARIGEDAVVKFGNNVSTTERLSINAAEGATLSVGNNVMIAAQVEIRCDDSHPIFDVKSGKRVNLARPIVIGDHVWISKRAVVMGGAKIGDGSVIGFGSIVTKKIPNNCVAAGIPARVIRRNVVWERPHLSMHAPGYKPDSSFMKRSEPFWNETESSAEVTHGRKLGLLERLFKKIGYTKVQ